MRVTLTEGICGGFVPPKVRRIVQFDTTSKLVEETILQDEEYVTKSGKLPDEVTSALVKKVERLRHLPTELPPFSSDIYGLDTSIIVEADDFQWGNGAPQGCAWSEPMVTISSEQKNEFQETAQEILAVGRFAQ
ncbi:hypothetical protein K493DRAFT_321011 [Basidiobolus meristosporus CBS 931.73]|uniref:Uncharacterized protein n=1 Tax=Basidiobolus meristosporus CBS 931.73 TaxID=1314790 RepID=A0A1Y1X253_9FUNG|nr:hypothetical protein K493DRAFT_321011 [Basidiobolus meristosporus CBS 931.73]|eukprot:ORX79708.1 hypothetical protein K493DRAFT_321011 [Basidiobolus meristosporus CBS 931.73]